jgi:hypothetical protein
LLIWVLNRNRVTNRSNVATQLLTAEIAIVLPNSITRKRPPQRGFVQVRFEDPNADLGAQVEGHLPGFRYWHRDSTQRADKPHSRLHRCGGLQFFVADEVHLLPESLSKLHLGWVRETN